MTNEKTEITWHLFLLACALAALMAFAPGCSSTERPPADPVAALSGVWTSAVDDSQIDLRADGQFFTDAGLTGT
jgi:hypothetical protein